VCNVLFQILLARALGASVYGLYALGYSVLGMAGQLSMLGLQNAAVRFGAIYQGKRDKSRVKGVFLSILFISTGSAVLVATLLLFFSNFIANDIFDEPKLTMVLRGFAFALPFYVLTSISASSARGLKCIKYSTGVPNVFHPISNLLIVGIALLLGFQLMGAVYGFVISSVLAAGLGIYLLWRIFPELTSQLTPNYELRKILGYSLTLFLARFSYIILGQTDRIMLGYFSVSKDVGIYNVAAVGAAQLPIFLTSLNALFSPLIADLHSRGQMQQIERLFKIVAKWAFSLSLPAFMVIILFPKGIMMIFGRDFIAGWLVLVTLGVSQLVRVSVGSVQAILIMTGQQKLELVNSVSLVIVNIFLNILLIQRYGILGAAIATGISMVLISLARLIEVYILFKIHPYESSFWKPIVAGLIGGGLLLGLSSIIPFEDWAWIGGTAIFLALYLGALRLFGFDREDMVVLQAVKRRLLQR